MGYPSVHGGSGFSFTHHPKVVEIPVNTNPVRRSLFPEIHSLDKARSHRLRRTPMNPLLPYAIAAGASIAVWFVMLNWLGAMRS